MKRRTFLRAGCAGFMAAAAPLSRASDDAWQMPPRFSRPDISTDEGGLWAMTDRAESSLRRSPFRLRDRQLRDYIQGIACRLGGEHCPDIRVHLVHTPYFNASMAPNGMMQVWTGLMLRVDNEAQLAAVLGHEIAHYLERHSIESLRDAKSRSAFGQFMGLFGVVGLLAQAGVLASSFAYSREHEAAADRIGALLMHRAGYDVAQAPKVWANLLLELQAKPGGVPNPLFATHPPQEERQAALSELAQRYPGGVANEEKWQQSIASHLHEWLHDEVKRGQHEESLAFLERASARTLGRAEYLHARGEVHYLRGGPGDIEAALQDFQGALAAGEAPAETHRALGMIFRARKQPADARASFERYLQRAPDAPDAMMIRNYIEELQV